MTVGSAAHSGNALSRLQLARFLTEGVSDKCANSSADIDRSGLVISIAMNEFGLYYIKDLLHSIFIAMEVNKSERTLTVMLFAYLGIPAQ